MPINYCLYPVESPTIYGGDEEKNVYSLLRVGFKAPPFLTGFTFMTHIFKTTRMGFVIDLHQFPNTDVGISLCGRKA
jgi:hypothetical protein